MALLTITDIVKLRDAEIAGILSETANYFPIVDTLECLPVPGTNVVNVPVENALMGAEFRTENTARTKTAPGLTNVTVNMKFLDASWQVDEQVAQSDFLGCEHALALMASNALKSAMVALEQQVVYGGETGYTDGFDGFGTMVDSTMVVDAGGSAGSDGSRVIISSEQNGSKLLVGQGGTFNKGDIDFSMLPDGFYGYSQALSAWGGLVVSKVSAGMITGLTESTGLTDDMISAAIAKFPSGSKPNAIYMSRRSLAQLQQSRTATNPTGAPAPFPTESFGVPVYATDSIVDTETIS